MKPSLPLACGRRLGGGAKQESQSTPRGLADLPWTGRPPEIADQLSTKVVCLGGSATNVWECMGSLREPLWLRVQLALLPHPGTTPAILVGTCTRYTRRSETVTDHSRQTIRESALRHGGTAGHSGRPASDDGSHGGGGPRHRCRCPVAAAVIAAPRARHPAAPRGDRARCHHRPRPSPSTGAGGPLPHRTGAGSGARAVADNRSSARHHAFGLA